jgi:flagellar biosynthesis protein FlhA
MALLGMPIGLILVVILFIIPIPTILLDVLIAANITAAIVILVIALHVHRPLEFSGFPTVVLVATLFRLALNVSVTRLVLLHGYAGSVIQAFGHFVVGSSVVVGLVIFLILIIIQFVVITNGAGRVAEVAARFTLDAMPGKQMAIDADLNAGLIDKDEARRRRAETAQEADFYGAMDGASKFVKGDAIAALVVVLINLVGGFIVGVVERHLSLSQAIDTYSLLSIGDGLASQIPALLISVSTGIIVTRAGEDGGDFGSDLAGQLRANYRAVIIGGSALGVLGLVPGLPKVFVVVGGAVAILGWRIASAQKAKAQQAAASLVGPATAVEPTPASMAVDLRTEALDIRLAPDWVPLIADAHGAELVTKVRSLRRKMGEEKGFIVPKVRLRDEATLALGSYKILLHGVEAGTGTIPPGMLLAVGGASETIEGERVRDPVYGVDAVLIPPHARTRAIAAGAVVMDRAAVVVAHLAEVIRRHAADLLTLQQVQGLIDVVRHTDPAVLDELTKCQLSTGDVLSVCRGLLGNGVGIGDFVRILETMTEKARRTKDVDALVEAARTTLRASICARWATDNRLYVVTLSPSTESALVQSLRSSDDGPTLGGSATVLELVIEQAAAAARRIENEGHRAVVVCSAKLRPALEKLLRRGAPSLGVLSVAEIPESTVIESCGAIDAVPETAAA